MEIAIAGETSIEGENVKKMIDEQEFVQAFSDYNREENFSIAGRRALFEYLTDLEEGADSEYTLDVIALCCEFSELTLDQINSEYSQSFKSIDEAQEWFQKRTEAIRVHPMEGDDRLIVGSF